MKVHRMTRRTFLKTGGAVVVAMSVGSVRPGRIAAQTTTTADRFLGKTVATDSVDGFLAIHADGTVTLFSGKVDLGTGARAALRQMAAEELDVPLDRITMIEGDTALTPDQNQREAIPSIIHLLNTRDHYLRADTINCLGKFMAEDAEEKLVHMYFNQPVNCQIEILKALERIATGNHLDFLKNEFLRSTDFELRKNAAKSIIRHQALATQMIQELLSNATTENALILKHCMNPLIKY